MPPLEFSPTVLAKINRSVAHTNELIKEVQTWIDTQTELKYKIHDNGLLHTLDLVVKAPPNLHDWSCIFGDAVHNMRSALDLWITERLFAETGSRPPNNFDFPIYPNDGMFKGWITRNKHLRLTDPLMDELEAIQPYHHDGKDDEALMSLHKLDIEDKHRSLLALGLNTYDADPMEFYGTWEPDPESDIEIVSNEIDPAAGGRVLEVIATRPLQVAQPDLSIRPIIEFTYKRKRRNAVVSLDTFVVHVQRVITRLQRHAPLPPP